MTVRFDDSLSVLVEVIRSELGQDALQTGTVLRDAVGRLAFFAAESLEERTVDTLSERLRQALGAYARTDRVIAGVDDYGAGMIRTDPSALPVTIGDVSIRLVDRRLVGADWLHAPCPRPRRHRASCLPA